jgi:hypothetical protein
LSLKRGFAKAILCSLRVFIVAHVVFSTVGAEMLTGGSVGAGWDQLERAGPKEARQVTILNKQLTRNKEETLARQRYPPDTLD